MKWRKRNPLFSSVEDVILFNTGMTAEEMKKEKEYGIEKMSKVAELIRDAVQKDKKVCVVTDYDADGICSAAIMKLTLDVLGADSYIRIPKRISEGYGLNAKIVDELPDNGLLVCVDNGIAAFDAIKKAKEKGLTVVILDHHMLAEDGQLPPADVIIDPSAIGEADFIGYCGAGLAYKLSVELLGKTHPAVAKCLSFAAIATVADVMPLIEDNRFIVKKGLKAMLTFRGRTKGLEELLKLNGLDVAVTEKNVGFKIAPCLNAPGRLYDDGASKSYQLLVCEDAKQAEALAQEIVSDNELRKQKKEEGVALLKKNIEENNLSNDVPLILFEPGLDEGLVGLFAGQFAEDMKRPCIIFTDTEDDILKGSARSYGDVHIKNILDENASLLHKFGGHKGAAGLSIKKDNLNAFRSALKKSLEGYVFSEDNCYDLEISAKNVSSIISKLEEFAPYGEGNPEIVFKVNDFCVSPTQKGYVQTMSDGKHGKVVNRDRVTAIAFGMGESLTKAVDGKPKTLNFYGTLSMNVSRFGSVEQIEVADFEVQEKSTPTTNLASKLRMAALK